MKIPDYELPLLELALLEVTHEAHESSGRMPPMTNDEIFERAREWFERQKNQTELERRDRKGGPS